MLPRRFAGKTFGQWQQGLALVSFSRGRLPLQTALTKHRDSYYVSAQKFRDANESLPGCASL